MKRILLVCEDKKNSTFLVTAAQSFIELYHTEFDIIPSDFEHMSEDLKNNIDLVLLAPQATYPDNAVKFLKGSTEVKNIPDEVYGWANGEKLVKFIMGLFPEQQVM